MTEAWTLRQKPEDVIVDREYWVRNSDDSEWYTAFWSLHCHNWTNGDTWEDFDRKITQWILIPTAEELLAQGVEAGRSKT